MNTVSAPCIADVVFDYIEQCDRNKLALATGGRDALRFSLNDEISIILIFNGKMKQWVLVAEHDVSHLSERFRDRLLDNLMDTASHGRADECLVVGLTASRKISVAKNLVDVSVKKDIINLIERITSVITTEKNEQKLKVDALLIC